MKNSIANVLIMSLVVMTMLGVVLGVYTHNNQQSLLQESTISLNDTVQAEASVSLSGFFPGDSKAYTLHLKANKGDTYNLVVSFQKTQQDSLAPFVDVQILLNGKQVDGAKLADYLAGRQTTLQLQFDEQTQMDIQIVYSMSLQVGNEAQNTNASFDVVLNVNR